MPTTLKSISRVCFWFQGFQAVCGAEVSVDSLYPEPALGSCLLDTRPVGRYHVKSLLAPVPSQHQFSVPSNSTIVPESSVARKWWEEQSSQEFAHRSLGGYLKGKDAVVSSWEQYFLKRFDWRGKRVLDYGIGGGYLGDVLFSTYGLGSYVGVDISNKSLMAAKRNLAKEVAQGKVNLLLTPQRFSTLKPDIVVCQAVIQHFPSVQYLNQFLENADNSGAAEMMLQIRYGNTTKDSSAYIGASAQDEHKVMLALVTNAGYLQSKLRNYELVWSNGPLETNQYLFTGWKKKQ